MPQNTNNFPSWQQHGVSFESKGGEKDTTRWNYLVSSRSLPRLWPSKPLTAETEPGWSSRPFRRWWRGCQRHPRINSEICRIHSKNHVLWNSWIAQTDWSVHWSVRAIHLGLPSWEEDASQLLRKCSVIPVIYYVQAYHLHVQAYHVPIKDVHYARTKLYMTALTASVAPNQAKSTTFRHSW